MAHTVGLSEILGEHLRSQGRDFNSLAREIGISRRYLCTGREQCLIKLETAVRIVEAAGLEVAQVFEHLDPLGLVAADLRRRLSGLDLSPR